MNNYSITKNHATLYFSTLFILLTLLLPGIGVSQIYECEIPEAAFTGTPETTLCEEYGEEIFDHILGEEGTQLSCDIGSSLSGKIFIKDDFYVVQNFTFTNAIIKINPGVSIIISPPLSSGELGCNTPTEVTLTINNSKLFACEGLWKEIRVYKNKRLNIINSQIEDAETAVNALNAGNAIINCTGTIFNRNRIGMQLKSYAFGLNQFPVIGKFITNRFKCDAPLNGTTDEISFAGISLINTPVSLFANSSARTNYFDGLRFGIHSNQGNLTVQLSYATFSNIQENAIFIKYGSLIASSILINDCGSHKIQMGTVQNVQINSSRFYFLNTATIQNIYCVYLLSFAPVAHVNIMNNSFSNLSATGNRHSIRIEGNDMAGETKAFITGNYFLNCGTSFRGTSTETTSVNYENNTFKREPSAPGSSQLIVFYGNKYNVKVIGNEFYAASSVWDESPMGSSNEVSDNDFYNTLAGAAHVNITNIKDLKICSNYVMGNFTATGSNPRTQLLDNVFPAASPMIRLQENSTISPQFNGGNKFYPLPLSIEPTPLMICSTYALALMSTFTVHEPQSVFDEIEEEYTYLSLFHPYNVVPDNGVYSDNFFFHKVDLEYSYDPCVTRAVHPDTLDFAIGHQLLDTLFSPARLFNLNYYLFDLLSNDSVVKNSDPIFDDFYELFTEEPEGILYTFNDSLQSAFEVNTSRRSDINNILELRDSLYIKISIADSILITFTDSSDYFDAINDKSSYLGEIGITDSIYIDFFEEWKNERLVTLENCKEILDIIPDRSEDITYLKFAWKMFLDNLINPGSISSADIDTLEIIAGLPEEESGLARAIASSLLPECDSLSFEPYIIDENKFEYESNSLIDKEAFTEGENAIEVQENMIKIQMFPNPTNSEISIIWDDLIINRILIYNEIGQTVVDITSFDTNHLNIKELKNGFYVACLIGQNERYCKPFVVRN